MAAPVKLKRKAKGERPYFFDDPNVDKVVAMVMGLAGEVAVMRDRLDTLERLLERSGALQRADIEQYRPDAQVVEERAAWREAFLGEVLRIIEIEVEALASGDQARYDTAIELVERDETPARPGASKRATAGARASRSASTRPAAKKARPAQAAAAKTGTAKAGAGKKPHAAPRRTTKPGPGKSPTRPRRR